jgi:hypothetical protein
MPDPQVQHWFGSRSDDGQISGEIMVSVLVLSVK